MQAAVFMLFAYCFAQLIATSSGTDESRGWLNSVVNLVEMDYADTCAERAAAEWDELTGSQKGLSKKLKRDKAFGLFAQKRRDEVKGAYSEQAFGLNDDVLRRKVKLLLQPGDLLLDTEQWIKLVTFSDTAQNKLRFATDYDCGTGTNCSLRELHISMAREQDEKKLLQMKKSWEKNLPDMNEYLEQILPLLRNSSKDYKTVEAYWDSLVEYEGAILKARELWDKVQPLYTKLQKYIALRLRGTDHVGKPLPAHLLRSLNGDDWSNVIESLLPKHPAIYQKVLANIQLKNLGGIDAYKTASKLLQSLKLGEIKPEVWSESIFNSTCPATLVDWCSPNKVRVATCKDANIQNYLDAHETATKIIYKQTTALYSNNTYILREAPRYSAIYEAIPGFVSLLALSPHALDRNGLFPFEIFNINANHHRLILQMILALRDLPKLNFYLAADEWRIRFLMGTIPPNNVATSWSEFRKNFSMIETSDVDILSDPYVLSNKPFIGKFMGLILKYQIYQSFAEELESDESDLLEHVALNNERLSETMMHGFSVKWPELVSDLLAKKENGLEYTGLTDYYQFLDEYLELQFDPTYNEVDELDDYLDPSDVHVPSADEDEFDVKGGITFEESIPDPLDPEFEPGSNEIETDENPKYNIETSTVAAMEVKTDVKSGDKKDNLPRKEGSYNVYWWIGIGVALAVIVILIAIIARKRHNHRKQLERQRENSHA